MKDIVSDMVKKNENMMNGRMLQGKTAVVTGCNRGIGKNIVMKFAEQGADVFACARRKSDEYENFLKEIALQYQVEIIPVYFDLSEESQIKEGIQSILKTKKPIDILVNNAGIAFGGTFSMTSMKKLKEVFDINYFAQIQIMQLVSRSMMKHQRGSIINMASVGGIEAEPGYLAYGSSKSALIWATRCLAKEVGAYGIRVNAVAPGLTETNMGHYKSEQEIDKVVQRSALGRMGQPEEIADAVLYLASDKSSFMTGQILRVDGGRSI